MFQDFAPTAFAFLYVLLPTLRNMGVQLNGKIIRPGYVPKGKGEIEVVVKPIHMTLAPLKRPLQGRVNRIRGMALSSHLVNSRVSERMAAACERSLRSRGYEASIEMLRDTHDHPAFERAAVQPGACLAL
jgi:RNA 3'-terminal phosphate cyclase (ATP)